MLILFVILIILIILLMVNISKKVKGKKETIQNNYTEEDRQVVRDYKIDSWGELIKIIIISGFTGMIGYGLAQMTNENVVEFAFFGAGFPWGYNVISKIIDDWVELWAFLASGWAWLILFIIKIALSIFLGAIIMPIKLLISIYDIIHAHSLSKEVNKKETVESNIEIVEPVIQENVKNIEKNNDDGIEKIKKLKSLLDEGILTQEEFEKKKNELLSKI